MSPDSTTETRRLDARFAGGLAWTAGVKWSTQLLTWASLLFLVRLLSPADYGLGGMAGISNNIANVLAEFGLGQAVLHMPELNRKALGQLHLVSMMLCTAMFALAALASPLLASFFRSGHAVFYLVNGLGLFITGFQAVPMGLLQRDMDYRRLSLAEAAMVLVQSVVTVATAWLGWGYWALLAGSVAGKTAAAALVNYWKPVPFAWPRWADIRVAIEMGRQVAVGRLAWSLYTQADGIVIGRIMGESVLGIYQMAMNLASAPAEKVSTLLMRTASPLFANVMDDRNLVRRYYLVMIEALSLIVMPLMLGLAMVAPQAVGVVLGPKWTAAAEPLRWLALFMIVRTMGVLTEQVLVSQRRTRFTMRMSLLNFCIMPVAFFAAARWLGTGAVAAAWLMLCPVTVFPLVVVLLRCIDLPFRKYLATFVPAATGSAMLCLAVAAFRGALVFGSLPAPVRLMSEVAVGGGVYGGVILLFFRGRLRRYVEFLRDLRGKRTAPAPG